MAAYCFIGDSRFVGIRDNVSPGNVTFIAKVGEGNSYYNANISSVSALDKNITIVYELGVNDLNSSLCVQNLKDLVSKGFKNIYFATVTPVDEAKAKGYGYSITNAQIASYNSTVTKNLPSGVRVIDCYSFFKSKGFSAPDGLHYDADTYNKWFNYIVSSAPAVDSSGGKSSAAAGSDKDLTLDQIAAEIAKGLVATKVEGPFDTFTKSTAGDYPSMGCSCWEGSRGDRILRDIGLGQYAGKSFSFLCDADKTGKAPKDEIIAALGSEKGKQVQIATLAVDTKNYVAAIKQAVSNMDDARCIIYAGMWCPTSTSCVCSHLKKNIGAVNDVRALNNAFIVNNAYAAQTARVSSDNYAGYYNRGNATLNYVLGLSDGKIGDIDIATLTSVQQGMAADGSLSAGTSSSASSSPQVKGSQAHSTHYKHTDTIYGSVDKLYCEPIYPDLVAVSKDVPGCVVQDVMGKASESEVSLGPNMTYDIPQETLVKHANSNYASSIMMNAVESEQKTSTFDRKSFSSMSKVPSSGKPPNNTPFPIDSKIEEMELHSPRVKIDKINACPEAQSVAQATIKLSMDVERRLVHLENNISTIMRYLARFAARVPVNCIYWGGTCEHEKYKTIRCLKDNRLEDGGLVTFDQCLACTRYSPIVGACYEILNDEGLNLSEVLDECQMSYSTPEEYLKFAEPTKRQDPLPDAPLGAASASSRNNADAAEDFASQWTPDTDIIMNWSLTPVEDQRPSINGDYVQLSSNMNTFTNSGMPMAGAIDVSNILTRQKELMDKLTENDFGYPLIQKAKEWLASHGDGYVANMNEYLYKNISGAMNTKKSSLDILLVAAVTCASGKDANTVINEMEAARSSLNAKDSVASLLLITQFHNMDKDNLYGTSGNATDVTLRKRLDKVTKIVTDSTDEAGSTEIGFGLDWEKVNEWNWTEYAEPLNINIHKDQNDPEIHESMELLPKVIYLYCLFREKCNSSRYDDMVHGYIFPFRESDLNQVYYTSDFYNQRSYGYHSAIDFGCDAGVDILAITDGVIAHAESGSGAGNALVLKHNDGLFSIYCHMQALEHKQGDKISKGQVIGHVGYTGHCEPAGPDGAHLHFQINEQLNGSFRNGAVDPAKFYTRLAGKLKQCLGS